ncbi:MAG: hypothetical protein LAN18_00900 [Acidobacteriia bacterium]|nr:hypothetical protein [Terriglobia bacterium]
MKTRLDRNRLRQIFVVLLLLVAATTAHAGTVSGVVRNGTNSNKPAAGVDVLLIELQGGMQTVASTKTDAEGRYRFDSTAIGAAPMLIRAVYRGMNFHQPLISGAPTVDVTVYEPTTNPQALQIAMRLLVFQPNGEKLLVGEEYSIQNDSNPPAAYYKQDGDFEFTTPQGAQLGQVSTVGPSGMPVTQGTIDKGKGRYAIAYVFQPGKNVVRLSYVVPYTGNQASLREASSYDAQRVLLVIPPTMQISSPGFNAAGMEQGFNVFSKESVKAGTGFDVSISGTAPPPSEASGAPDQTNGRDSGPGPTVETAPARLGDEKWILLGGLAAIFAVGVGLLLRRPAPAVPSAPPPASPSSGPKGRKAQRAAQAQAKTKSAAMPAPLAEKVDQEVNTNLDSLKDTLLRIELRRQAGTISEEEYARERGRAEQLLRDLVQG